jgi:hypothetical protein
VCSPLHNAFYANNISTRRTIPKVISTATFRRLSLLLPARTMIMYGARGENRFHKIGTSDRRPTLTPQFLQHLVFIAWLAACLVPPLTISKADVAALVTKYPDTIDFGGNTGTVNSFTGLTQVTPPAEYTTRSLYSKGTTLDASSSNRHSKASEKPCQASLLICRLSFRS